MMSITPGKVVSLLLLLHRVKCSFVVSGSKDSTIKLWSLKSLRGHDEGAGPVRLTVKYTQLAHDKVQRCTIITFDCVFIDLLTTVN